MLALLAIAGMADRRAARADAAQAAGKAQRGFIPYANEGRKYIVFVPSSPPPQQGYPLILFLHSAGERGTDGQRQLDLGLGPAIRRRAESFPGIVVFPQADYADGPILETWRAGEPQGELARAILEDVEKRWPVDPERRAITGWSMGGYGALSHAAADPEHFSRVLAVAGGGEPQWGPSLARLPVWLVHGADDRVVPPSESRTLISQIPEPHERVYYSEVPSARHDIARSVYENQAVLDWLLSADEAPPPVDAITAPEPVDAITAAGTPSAAGEAGQPFAPDLIISRAISLRLGNEALKTLACGVPESMAEEGLRGTLPPVEDRVEFDGQTYDVRFRDMSYQGRLQRAVLEGCGPGRVRVAFALKDFEVRIGSIEVSSETDGVSARDVAVVIGHREPVGMNLEVNPLPSDDGRLRLELLDVRFAIDDHNWYVEPPEEMQIRGDLFTEEMVRTAIVGGVYRRRNLIEQKIIGAADPILRQVEQRIDFAPLAQLVQALWPLPVYQPRLRVHLEEVSTDADGVSLVFGCEVDDPAQQRSRRPERVNASTPPAEQIEPATDLRAAVAVDVVEHISALLAGTEMMAIYGADVPGRPFRELDDVADLSQSLPELRGAASLADVRTRLALSRPFRYIPLGEHHNATSTVSMAIEVPELSLTLFAKEDAPQAQWAELARRELFLQQPIELQARPQLDGPTELELTWGEEATIDAAQQQSADAAPDEIVSRCRKGWSRWVGLQQISATVPDVAVGSSALRLSGFCWEGACLTAEFQPAATVLVNTSSRPVEYCIRSEHSRWSRPLTLPPHAQHIFRSGVTMQVRRASRWSTSGEPLNPGTYDWSERPDSTGLHWIARRPGAAPARPTLSLSPQGRLNPQ
jgi:predicted esterase